MPQKWAYRLTLQVLGFHVLIIWSGLDANLPRLMEWVDRFTGEKLPQHYRELFRSAMSDPENNWYRLIESMYTDIDSRVTKAF